MTLPPVLGALLILIVCPILGGLPLIAWITQALTQRKLAQLGTGNLSVSAAFYHGGQTAGILAVLSEAFKGIAAVLLARYFFPSSPVWELVALMALVVGRYGIGKGAGTTNVVWGFVAHDWLVASWVFLLGGIGFTLLRERQSGRLGVLVLLPIVVAVLHPYQSDRIFATMLLSLLIALIYQRIPDDLDLSPETSSSDSRKMFQFFRGDRALLSLDKPLDAAKVGNKAANLSQLRRWGYPVPIGWVIPPGDDPAPLIEMLHPSPEIPLVVRSSAIGEDSETASAAGQYDSILQVTSQAALEQAILRCHASYNDENAIRYRRDKGIAEGAMAVVVQIQVQGVFSGVAFSRDPIARQGDAVVVEGLPGLATQVVSGQVTPEMYRVWIREEIDSKAYALSDSHADTPPSWLMPDWVDLDLEGTGDLPPRLVKQVAFLARHIEKQYHGIPQDIEWSYDGQYLWLLQARPITTLLPIWTRKIAAEVIPGYIHPLTWSINRPLTCGAWGDLFTLVLGDRASGLDFNETATLHHAAAYFNASLLGQLFLRMGLPPESLEFLTRGAKFSKPPLRSTLQSAPGLLRLLRRELRLNQDFSQDWQEIFEPGLAKLASQTVDRLSAAELLQRIEQILKLLQRATYYSILAPLSAALRQAIFSVPETSLDNSQTPEVASMRSLQSLATQARAIFSDLANLSPETLFVDLADMPQGQTILQEFDRFLAEYGYLSDVATDIAVPNWKEAPDAAKALFTQLVISPARSTAKPPTPAWGWKRHQVQKRLDLKGQVTVLYSKLLAELRWSFLVLEHQGLETGWLAQAGDIFFLKFAEVERWIAAPDPDFQRQLAQRIQIRRSQLQSDRQLTPPLLVYGNDPPRLSEDSRPIILAPSSRQLHGIGASPGQVEGRIVVLQSLQTYPEVSRDIILVIPYADSGWAPLLAQAGGLITEVGGQLSHGAIVAREYGIPAVMNIAHATQRLQDGQRVRIDGQRGIVEILP